MDRQTDAVGPPGGDLTVGQLGRPHGLHGEIHAKLISENIDRFTAGSALRLTRAGPSDAPHAPVTVRLVSARQNSGKWLLKLDGVASREAAEALRGAVLSVSKHEAAPLPGQVWLDDLVGLEAVDRSGRLLGTVDAVLTYPAQDLVAVKTQSGRVLVPNVEEIIPEVDVEGGRIVIDPPTGMFDDAKGATEPDEERDGHAEEGPGDGLLPGSRISD